MYVHMVHKPGVYGMVSYDLDILSEETVCKNEEYNIFGKL